MVSSCCKFSNPDTKNLVKGATSAVVTTSNSRGTGPGQERESLTKSGSMEVDKRKDKGVRAVEGNRHRAGVFRGGWIPVPTDVWDFGDSTDGMRLFLPEKLAAHSLIAHEVQPKIRYLNFIKYMKYNILFNCFPNNILFMYIN